MRILHAPSAADHERGRAKVDCTKHQILCGIVRPPGDRLSHYYHYHYLFKLGEEESVILKGLQELNTQAKADLGEAAMREEEVGQNHNLGKDQVDLTEDTFATLSSTSLPAASGQVAGAGARRYHLEDRLHPVPFHLPGL